MGRGKGRGTVVEAGTKGRVRARARASSTVMALLLTLTSTTRTLSLLDEHHRVVGHRSSVTGHHIRKEVKSRLRCKREGEEKGKNSLRWISSETELICADVK